LRARFKKARIRGSARIRVGSRRPLRGWPGVAIFKRARVCFVGFCCPPSEVITAGAGGGVGGARRFCSRYFGLLSFPPSPMHPRRLDGLPEHILAISRRIADIETYRRDHRIVTCPLFGVAALQTVQSLQPSNSASCRSRPRFLERVRDEGHPSSQTGSCDSLALWRVCPNERNLYILRIETRMCIPSCSDLSAWNSWPATACGAPTQ
jgi:hypothetical protein